MKHDMISIPFPGSWPGVVFFFCLFFLFSRVSAQVVLFDFDNAPLHSPLPIDQTASGITAHFSATGQGYSIQEVNVHGFTPQGFAGRMIDPSSIYLADLLIRFDQALTDFSIMYACQELGCDDAATMRVTAYMNGSLVGTNTKTARFPGTWPVDTLSCSFPQGFDSVVVHYASPPPTCKDYGVIYMADNMQVTPKVTAVSEGELPEMFALRQNYPNPFNPGTIIEYVLPVRSQVHLGVYNILGKVVANLAEGIQDAGAKTVHWDAAGMPSGIYYYRLDAPSVKDPSKRFSQTRKMMLIK